MPPSNVKAATLAALLVTGALVNETRAGTPVEFRHQAWRSCLVSAFTLRAALASPMLAADAAFGECRENETAYLAALSASPLVDEDDVARAKPALLARAKTWLLTNRPQRSL